MEQRSARTVVIARIGYLFRRSTEVPFSVLIQKVWMRVRPSVYFPDYRFGLTSRRGNNASVDELREFGARLRPALGVDPGAAIREHLERNEFPCLGYGVISIPKGGQWHADSVHGHQWPVNYFSNVDFLATSAKCDVKVAWEMARLQYALWMAQLYISNPDENAAYIERYQVLVTDFIAQNRTAYGVNWTCPMEVAIRAVNLAFSAALLAEELSAQVLAEIVDSLADHLVFIERFPETSDVNGNHYLADLMGMYVLSRVLYGSGAQKTDVALARFSREAALQFEDNGGHIERAPVYHRLCAEKLAVVAALSSGDNDDGESGLVTLLDRCISFCESVGSATRSLPVLGDADSGHVIWFGEDARDFTSLVEFRNALTIGYVSPEHVSLKARWLIALSGDKVASLPAPEQPENNAGVCGGFAYLKSGPNELTMRVDAQGLEGRAPHDHDDSQSIWLFHQGRDFIIDAGCHSYTLDPAIRQRDIASSAHNVLRPPHRERFESVAGSVFKTVRGAPVATVERLEHDGDHGRILANLVINKRGVFESCTREVSMNFKSLRVEDKWHWSNDSAARIRWQFAPWLQATILQDTNAVALTDEAGECVAVFAFESDRSLDLHIEEARFAPSYGASVICDSVVVDLEKHERASLLSTLSFSEVSQ